ncbi:hypothetical protein TrRE_jg8069, partial [Triparma retinervis]
MRAWRNKTNVRIRPHYKTHKCPSLAELTLRQTPTPTCPFPGGGADGICVQTLDELASLTQAINEGWGDTWTEDNHGVVDILLTNTVIGPLKISRFLDIVNSSVGRASISLLVDDLPNLVALKSTTSSFGVFVEVNVGQNRGGVTPTPDNLPLILSLALSAGDAYRGLHCYHGLLQHVNSRSSRASQVLSTSVSLALLVSGYLSSNGVRSPIITGGGTGTYHIEVSRGCAHNEVQPGSFLLGDTEYGDVEKFPGEPTFEHALWVNAGVCSTAAGGGGGHAVVDAGSKAVDLASGNPSVAVGGKRMGFSGERDSGVGYKSGGDDHGVL